MRDHRAYSRIVQVKSVPFPLGLHTTSQSAIIPRNDGVARAAIRLSGPVLHIDAPCGALAARCAAGPQDASKCFAASSIPPLTLTSCLPGTKLQMPTIRPDYRYALTDQPSMPIGNVKRPEPATRGNIDRASMPASDLNPFASTTCRQPWPDRGLLLS
jgi:hypothetical protein